MAKLSNIDYKKIFYYFEEISAIPRGSGNNKGISDYLVSFAKEHNLKYIQDEFYNVIIYKDATCGYEDKPGVILQAHMDMVCEKSSDIEHDFLQDGIELIIDDSYVKANGTTLGGDDGIGVAYILAFLDDDSLEHPYIEALITTDEEVGMDGSIGLDGTLLKGKYLLNIDSEEEGIFLSSCAGGATVECTLPIEKREIDGINANIFVKGLKSGHSGTDINNNRQNASVVLIRILNELRKTTEFSLISMQGGSKDNVITAEAKAELVIVTDDINCIICEFNRIAVMLKKEFAISEPGFETELFINDYQDKTYLALSPKSTQCIIDTMLCVPNGVQVMSSAIEGLVESSINLGVLRLDNKGFVSKHSVRSSINDYKRYIVNKIQCLYGLSGGTVKVNSEYPAWEYKRESHLREVFCSVYRDMFNKEAKVCAIHAGLECGILADKINGLDIVSFGPDIFDIHTVKERMNIESAKRVYDLMVKVIEKL